MLGPSTVNNHDKRLVRVEGHLKKEGKKGDEVPIL